jgi:hypothetical protein
MGTRLTPEQKRERDRARRAAKLSEEMDKANARASEPRPPLPDPDEPLAWLVVQTAREIGREADLYYRAHVARYSHRPSEWTKAQKIELLKFVKSFIRPDGTPPPKED